MSTSVLISAALMGLFVAGAFAWSVLRILRTGGVWRIVHTANVGLMVMAAGSVALDKMGLSMLAGIGILLLSLAVMLMDKTPQRWVAFILVVAGILLASGLPFVTS